MSVQTSYLLRMAKAFAGTIGDVNPHIIISKACETAAIPFGRMVQRGTADNQCLLGGTSDKLGISCRSMVRGIADEQYEVGDMVNVMEDGYVYCEIDSVGAANAGAALTYIDTTGQLSTVAPDGTHTAANAVLEEDISAGGEIALVRIIRE